jgi:hypothetical protein
VRRVLFGHPSDHAYGKPLDLLGRPVQRLVFAVRLFVTAHTTEPCPPAEFFGEFFSAALFLGSSEEFIKNSPAQSNSAGLDSHSQAGKADGE